MTGNTGKILLVDDDPEIAELIGTYLEKENFCVLTAARAEDAIEIARREKPALIILDILLPGLDGFEACRLIRQITLAPIIIISCKGDEADKVLGLGLGADDYLVKPFSPRELLARVKTQLRRADGFKDWQGNETQVSTGRLEFPGLVIDLHSRCVEVAGHPIELTAKEFDLLCYLARHPNRVFSRQQLYEAVWADPCGGDDRTVMVYVSRLRQKLEQYPGVPRYLRTVWGVGYKFEL